MILISLGDLGGSSVQRQKLGSKSVTGSDYGALRDDYIYTSITGPHDKGQLAMILPRDGGLK